MVRGGRRGYEVCFELVSGPASGCVGGKVEGGG